MGIFLTAKQSQIRACVELDQACSSEHPCTMNSVPVDTGRVAVVVVARHGERLDYVSRESGGNWVSTSERPFDPPLTKQGIEQAVFLGRHLASANSGHLLFPSVALPTNSYWHSERIVVEIHEVV
jgi:hypothetical protein